LVAQFLINVVGDWVGQVDHQCAKSGAFI
jgi:hypothetical protein